MHIKFNSKKVGFILLALSGVLVKLAGLLFKIPLTRLVGEAGMGCFNSAYSIFAWLYTISTAGLPSAAAMLVSRSQALGRRRESVRLLRLSMAIFLILGVLGSAVMLVGAGSFARLIRVEDSRLAMLAIAPTLLFVCQSAAMRGYFQGRELLIPHALSQTAEAVGKLAFGVSLAKLAVKNGAEPHEAAAFAAGGLTLGVALGCAILLVSTAILREKYDANELSRSRRELTSQLVRSALPITLAAGLSSLSSVLDTLLMTRGLHRLGYSQVEAAAIWGNYSSLALPMYNLPPMLVYPLSYALMPELAGTLESRPERAGELARRAFSLSAAIGIPCATGLAALAEPLLAMLFGGELASRGAPMLTLLAPSSLLLCLMVVTNTLLQSCSLEREQLAAMLAGTAVKLTAGRFLPELIGRYATPTSTLLGYLTVVTLSLAMLETRSPLAGALRARELLAWLPGTLAAVAAAVAVERRFGVIPAVVIAVVVYAALYGRRLVRMLKTEET